MKQTGGLTLASAFGLGFVANKQRLLAADSGGGSPPPPAPPPPPPSYYLTYLYSAESGLASPGSNTVLGMGTYQVHLQISMDPEPNYTNQSPTITATFRARVWTTGGNAKSISGYSTAGYPRLGETWPFAGVAVGGSTEVAKEAKAEFTVVFSIDPKGHLVINGGENWVDAEEEKMVVSVRPRDARVRKVVSHVQIRRQGLIIQARGWVAHMFDGFYLDRNSKVYDGIQNDLTGSIEGHTRISVPSPGSTGGATQAGMPFTRTYQIFGPYAH